MGPELIDPQRFGFQKVQPTKYSDCYALGMVIYETISGHFPFHQHVDLTVIVKVMGGRRPPREEGFTDNLWKMLELCWTPQPSKRPSIEDVLRCLEGVLDLSEPLSPWVDEETETDSDDCDPANEFSGMFSHFTPSAAFHGLSVFRWHRHADAYRWGSVYIASEW